MKNNQYNLLTTIGMIVGIVIGSGIFFKSDNILVATNGSIALGILAFCIAAMGIIFGGLSIAELASRTNSEGGLVAYVEKYCSSSIACAIGWFFSLLYYPTLLSVVSWVSGVYICQLFNINGTFNTQILIGVIVTLAMYIINILSVKLGGYLQTSATIIKLIPLVFIAIAGLLFGDSSHIDINHATNIQSLGWLSAITPIAFAFDGWIVSTSLSGEIKNPKRNLPIALISAPIFILLIYIAYFVGISIYVGPDKVMELGDLHVAYAANMLLGNLGSKIILIFVTISVLGTLNGLTIGSIRMPHTLAIRKMIPSHEKFSKLSEKYQVSIASAILSLLITYIGTIVHYFTQKYNLLPNSDVSEIAVIFSYIIYIILFIQVIKLGIKKEIKSTWRGIINPILAILGSLIVLIGSLSNPLIISYSLVFIIILLSAIIFWKKTNK